jgi:hypothetical protein
MDVSDDKRLFNDLTASLLDRILQTENRKDDQILYFAYPFHYDAVLNHITLVLLPASITYIGKKAIDVLMKLVESAALKKLESREEPGKRIIELYDGSGAVVARVEVPSLPPKD